MAALRQRLGPNAARVAAASSLALVAIVLAFVVFGSGGNYAIKAQFDDVRGLLPGAPVRAGAVDVGSVGSIDLVRDRPVVTMQINDDFHLHEGATADIQLYSNAGAVNRTVELTQGDPTRPRLREGSTMTARYTDQPVNFDDATETLNAPTRANIKRLLIGLDATLKGRGKDFDRTLRHSSAATNEVANLLAQVNSDGYSLKTLVGQGSRVTSSLASSPGDLAATADTTASLLTVTARRQAEIRRSVELLGPALTRTGGALETLADATPRLRRLVRALGPAAQELGPFSRALPPTLEAAGPFLAETRALVRNGPRYVRAFAPIIASAHRVTGGLGTTIDAVLPLGNALRAYVPDTVGFFQNLGSILGSFDANGHVANLTGALFTSPPPSTAAAEIGPNDCTAGRLRRPYLRAPGALECQPWTDYEGSFIGTRGGGR